MGMTPPPPFEQCSKKLHFSYMAASLTSPTISSLSSSTRLPTKLLEISNVPKIFWNMKLAKQSLHSNIYKNGWKHATLNIAPKYTIYRYGQAANLFRSQSEVITAPCSMTWWLRPRLILKDNDQHGQLDQWQSWKIDQLLILFIQLFKAASPQSWPSEFS